MGRSLLFAVIALCALVSPTWAGGITGQYIEARTCDVWTGPCFANAEINLSGKHGVLAWKIEKGSLDNVKLDGLGVVAIVAASDTLGLAQTGPSKAVLIVDERATPEQRAALVRLAQKEGGELVRDIVQARTAKIELEVMHCKEGGCARLDAGLARIETRCLNHHDKVCGNETAFYPPLSKHVKAEAAMATEHTYKGTGLNQTWAESERRGAYVGTFEVQ